MKLSELPPPPPGKTGWPWTEGDAASSAAGDRITVVTPSYNQGSFLEETIRSVLLQGGVEVEYLVLDGGSTDNSVDVIRKYERHLAYWRSEKDGGQANALNAGFHRATSEWITWINSDDYLLPGSLRRLVATKADWAGGSVRFTFLDTAPDEIRLQGTNRELVEWLTHSSHFHQPGTIWRKALFDQVGYLDETMHYAFDWEFWCRLAASGFQPAIVTEPVAVFRHHDESKTCSYWDRFCAENIQTILRYRSQLDEREKRIVDKTRTGLVCTRIKHEATRLLHDGRTADAQQCVTEAIAERPQILLKKTPYLFYLRASWQRFFHGR